MPEYWIQIENRPWDVCPHNIDRMTGQKIVDREKQGATPGPSPVSVFLPSSIGGPGRTVTMFKPLRDSNKIVIDALILRRYKPPTKPDQSDAWTVPDDRKVNPWDLNEPNPSESGTMGTIPGPVIECNVGDTVTVHFRNMDKREAKDGSPTGPFPPMAIEKRCHSLHPHGFVFKPQSDGAYPLSPPDSAQPVPASEAAAWASVPGFSGPFKKGDRVPPGGTFTYTWSTFGWPTTAGVWLYHDHSICDMDNVGLGAIGIIVIHNPSDTEQEVDIRTPANPDVPDPAFLPGGSPNGSPVQFPFISLQPATAVGVLPHHLDELTAAGASSVAPPMAGMPGMPGQPAAPTTPAVSTTNPTDLPNITTHSIQQGNILMQLNPDLTGISRLGLATYRTPPTKALYLQLFHALGSDSTCINGRQYLGNTPTMIAGPATRMRFGVVGMGSEAHTFHIHGHRWIIPGPDGLNPANIQNSAQVRAVSQFEDTRIFGPANSFVFTIPGQSGSFMRAGGPGPADAVGEWHMHCHVLMHMMTGMMGSLMIINGGELASALPVGVPCPDSDMGSGMTGMGPNTVSVHVVNFQFNPDPVNIKVGDTVHWIWDADNHSTTSDTGIWDSGVHNTGFSFSRVFSAAGNFPYFCSIHGGPGGAGMHGTVHVTP